MPVPTTPYSLLIKSPGLAVDPEPIKGDVVEVTSDVPVPNTPPRVVELAGVETAGTAVAVPSPLSKYVVPSTVTSTLGLEVLPLLLIVETVPFESIAV